MTVSVHLVNQTLKLIQTSLLTAPTDYLIATTNIINGTTFLESLMETLHRSS